MSFWAPAPPPPTSLGYYRALAKSASIHASPIALGGMSLGTRWEAIGVVPNPPESSKKLLDAYFDNGGNFIDTANHYQAGQSEEIIGEWMEERKIRDQIILVTKYTQADHKGIDPTVKQRVNYIGNNKKSMNISIAESLARLRTHYVDIFYVHWWDFETSVEEVMNSLHDLVQAGKVLYLGASDMPAWVVAKANQYAIDHGKTPFSIYTGAWNVLDRSFEGDIIPMARDFDMALAPWNVLAGGKFRSDEEEEKRKQNGEKGRDTAGTGWERTEEEKAISRALEKVAKEVGAHSLGAVAIAYLFHKYHRVFPVVGGRKVEHLLSNVEAIDIKLSKEQIEFIESQKPYVPAFPHSMIGNGLTNNILLDVNTTVARLPPRGIIEPKGLSKN